MTKIRNAYSKDPGDDASDYPRGTASYSGKNTVFNRLLPYGLCALEPKGSFVVLFGESAVKYGIPAAAEQRLKNLKPGEAALYNAANGIFVKINEDGSITTNGTRLIVENDAEIGGKSFLQHVHTVPQGGQTSPPV